MYVTVLLKVELEATATLSQLESQIEEAGRAAMQAALQQAIQHQEAQESTCPRCGSDQCHAEGTKRRVLLTRFGRVEVPLKRPRCLSCRRLFRPAASCLAEVQGYNVTPALRELAALVGSAWPDETAAGVLKRLSGVHLSDERLRHLTNEQGSCLARQHQESGQQVLADAINLPLIRRARTPPKPATSALPEWVQVGLDGGWVPSREQKGGMEGKIGVVASHVEPVGKHGRHRLSQRRDGATCGSAQEVGMLTDTAASALGATQAKQQVVLGDGADWIKTQAEEHIPLAVKILDWPPLWRKMRDAVRAVQPGKHAARRAWRKAQYEVLLPLLWQGERDQASRHVQGLCSTTGDMPLPLKEALESLETQRGWLGTYQQWREQGYPVGSGLVERAVALIINVRMKKRGMRWKRANATAVVALRVHYINADWEAVA